MSVLFQMPTGTGKTTVFAEIIRRAQAREKKVLVVVHRTELVEQIVDRLGDFQVVCGVISSNIKADEEKRVQVATIQTLSKRTYPKADIVIIDECHHAKASTYKKLWDIYPEARFLGVTATPVRINGEGFDDLFDILIPLGNLSFFISQKFLVPVKHLVCSIPDLSKVSQRMKDYDIQMLRDVMLENTLMANLVDSYKKYALGKKTIVFAVDIEHSKQIVQRYNLANIPAAHLDSTTKKRDRMEILQKFKDGEFLVLSNVDIVSEGFDVPTCEAVQLARPTKSLALYLQQVGRCMRTSPGKENGIVLDNAGLWLEHGLSFIDRDWTLQGKKKRKTSHKASPSTLGFDDEGVLREVKIPEEAEGLELVEISEELERLLVFESFVRVVKANNHQPISAVYKYRDYLIEKSIEMTDVEEHYCASRMKKIGFKPKKGFWYYRKVEIIEGIKAKNSGTK